jgi:signal-transduction protein with cAMP-binding, CBS, and nucleotidyltransferase domain
MYDFNLVIEEFEFYQQITPKMQTDLIQNTRVFQEFEKSFNHFFDECERGFTNELIINMYCRIYTPGKTVISYKSNVKELFFIRQGIVELYTNEGSEDSKDKQPILYLPKFSYFGDYQILYNLKSNIVFRTLSNYAQENKKMSELPDIIFMCICKNNLMNLCELFPQTAENIKRKSLERRKRFMQQKDAQKSKKKETQGNTINDTKSAFNGDDDLKNFQIDEEPEKSENQKEDMKQYLSKLNKRIDTLVGALSEAEK